MKTYQRRKELLRQQAINWQMIQATGKDQLGQSYSLNDIIEQQERFEKSGRKYGLLKEFRENGII